MFGQCSENGGNKFGRMVSTGRMGTCSGNVGGMFRKCSEIQGACSEIQGPRCVRPPSAVSGQPPTTHRNRQAKQTVHHISRSCRGRMPHPPPEAPTPPNAQRAPYGPNVSNVPILFRTFARPSFKITPLPKSQPPGRLHPGVGGEARGRLQTSVRSSASENQMAALRKMPLPLPAPRRTTRSPDLTCNRPREVSSPVRKQAAKQLPIAFPPPPLNRTPILSLPSAATWHRQGVGQRDRERLGLKIGSHLTQRTDGGSHALVIPTSHKSGSMRKGAGGGEPSTPPSATQTQ